MFQNVSKCFKVPTVVFQRLGGGCQGWGNVVVLQDDLATATAATAGTQRSQKVSWDQLSHGESRCQMLRDAERCWVKVLRCSQMFSVHSQRRTEAADKVDHGSQLLGIPQGTLVLLSRRRQHVEHLSYSPMSEFAWKTWPTFGEVLLKRSVRAWSPCLERSGVRSVCWSWFNNWLLFPNQCCIHMHTSHVLHVLHRITTYCMSSCSSPSCSPIWFPSKSRVCSLTILSYRSMHSCHILSYIESKESKESKAEKMWQNHPLCSVFAFHIWVAVVGSIKPYWERCWLALITACKPSKVLQILKKFEFHCNCTSFILYPFIFLYFSHLSFQAFCLNFRPFRHLENCKELQWGCDPVIECLPRWFHCHGGLGQCRAMRVVPRQPWRLSESLVSSPVPRCFTSLVPPRKRREPMMGTLQAPFWHSKFWQNSERFKQRDWMIWLFWFGWIILHELQPVLLRSHPNLMTRSDGVPKVFPCLSTLPTVESLRHPENSQIAQGRTRRKTPRVLTSLNNGRH